MTNRPRNVLVLLNPFGGKRAAKEVWQTEAAPILQLARVATRVIETTRPSHARDVVEGLSAMDLKSIDGILAVGGDGLFQEVVCSLLNLRSRGGEAAAVAIRVAHIPAGSTDAAAYTIHGTRCATTAALHVALGSRLSLDVGRLETLPLSPPSSPLASSSCAPSPLTRAFSDSSVALRLHSARSPSLSTAASGTLLSPPAIVPPSLPSSSSSFFDPAIAQGSALRSSTLTAPTTTAISSTTTAVSPTTTISSTVANIAASHSSPSLAQPCPQPLVWPASGQVTKHFVCQAAYGFLGDVMRDSEVLRVLGPARYDVTGFLKFLQLKSYKLVIRFKPAEEGRAVRGWRELAEEEETKEG
eukprot:CAMPEP_0175042712 /NCGR_PEP_ID=MMETSP0052_2-20121109/2737_1 /TAXON_ID=51329 ORGANISM="Polytomella parva, Strain SAG 63-3" /NCGR_SAMPLE_ID=MMETSP0052_2 /ASSEMBLY_ACC=CAM_ASM_000194 /LENGTH=356 /DNA_ID=CAMNT_0016305597 /DNA_START=642 /DNA_END=1709 /DNA_ORIENTATION=+